MARLETKTVAASMRDALSGADVLNEWSAGASELKFGQVDVLTYGTYVQFPIDLPAGVTVYDAILELTPSQNCGTGASSAQVSMMDYFAGDLVNDISSNGEYSASLAWLIAGTWSKDTPAPDTRINVGTLVQQLIDRVDYASGDQFTIRITATSGGVRYVHAYDGSPAQAAKLTIRYYRSATDKASVLLEDLIADAASFRTWTGAADRHEALAYIHCPAAESNAVRPFVLLDPMGEEFSVNRIGTQTVGISGAVQALFVTAIDDADVDEDGTVTAGDKMASVSVFESWVLSIAHDIHQLGQQPGYLNVSDIGLAGKPALEPRPDRAMDKAEQTPVDVTVPVRIAFGVGPSE